MMALARLDEKAEHNLSSQLKELIEPGVITGL
jgi:hypothetical protein